MEEYKRSQIPAFGYWDFSDDLPITQYFESAAQAGLIRYNHVAADTDLYGYDLKRHTSAAVSRPKMKEGSKICHQQQQQQVSKEQKKQGRVCDATEAPRPARAPKAVDEDLYKIPPELLHQKPKRRSMVGFWSCLSPSCMA